MKPDIFSPTEQKVLEVLGRKKMSISQITRAILEGRTVFLADQNHVAGAVRRINEKCERNNLSWFLNGIGSGRAGRVVWKEKR
jgi:hypothetical protein